MKLRLDLSPWIRGPSSGVGLTTLRSAQALMALLFERNLGSTLKFSSKDLLAPRSEFEKTLNHKIAWLNPVARVVGTSSEIFHSFELRLPPVWRSKRVITVHDVWTLDRENRWQAKAFQRKQEHLLRKALESAHRVLTPTEAVRNHLLEFMPEWSGRTYVVPWGPLLDERRTDHDPVLDLPEKVREYLADDRLYVFVVASLEIRKNHTTVFEAMKKIKGVDLVLSGREGFGGAQVKKEIQELRDYGVNVEYFENLDVKTLTTLYDRCLALVSASYDEGFGLPVLEAMSRGKPVVLSKIAAHEEVAGNAALYFDVDGGTKELREYIEALRDDIYVRRELSERSIKRAANFSWKKTAEKTLEVYQSLMRG